MIFRRIALCLALFCSAPLAVHAEAPALGTGRVGRVSYLSGSVSVQPAGLDAWTPAAINRVISDGDHVFAGAQGRVELHMGRLVVRLDSGSVLEVQQLTAHGARLALMQGRANVSLLSDGTAGSLYEIDMPTAAANIQSRGVYTLRAAADGSASSITVRRGSAELFVDGTATAVAPETTARAQDRQPPQLRSSEAPDAFDAWSSERQRHDDAAVALRYVRPEVVGYEDLDTYGSWRESKDYGPLWQPKEVAADWAPYHDGQWSYTRAWGWTWNDDAPWGFAPSHYGRWVYEGDAWAWAPGQDALAGTADEEPIYAPATVAFLQAQAADEAMAAFVEGAMVGELLSAWVPLAPGEPLMASYGGYYRAPVLAPRAPTNTAGVAQVSHGRPIYASRPGAVVLGGRDAFRNAVPIHYRHNLLPDQLAQLRPVTGSKVATPTLAAVVATPARGPARVAQPPSAALSRMVVAHAPAPARPAQLVTPPPVRPAPRDRNADEAWAPPPPRSARPLPLGAGGREAARLAPAPSRVWSETVPLHGEHPASVAPSMPRPLPHPSPGWSPHHSAAAAAPAAAPVPQVTPAPAPAAVQQRPAQGMPVPSAPAVRPVAPAVRPVQAPPTAVHPAPAPVLHPGPAPAPAPRPAPAPVPPHPGPMPIPRPGPIAHPR